MPSRLSSLLVRDGLVGVKRMEKAFQRQVIYGGSLDTILLEMGLVPEERLVQYLALASGLPPAARDEGTTIDPVATTIVSREISEKYRAVPVALDGDALRLLVCSPLEMTQLEDLADLIDRPLQPLITPEYRWHLAHATAYSLDPPARFTTLARSLDVDSPTPAIGRAKSVIIENPVAPIANDAPTMRVETGDAPPQGRAGRTMTDAGILMPRSPGPTTIPPREGRTSEPPPLPPPEETTDPGDAIVVDTPLSAVPEPLRTVAGSRPIPVIPVEAHAGLVEVTVPKPLKPKGIKRIETGPIISATVETAGRDSPLPIGRAREILTTAEDRDTVFLTLLRATRARARWAGLLTVQGGAAIGRLALAEPEIDTAAVTTILIPLDAVSPFRTVISTKQPHIGPLVSGDPGIDAMLLRMGGTVPPSALIMPIVLRDRPIALLVAHRGQSDIRIVDVMELLALANVASDAIGRLIVRHKAAGYRSAIGGGPGSAAPNEFEGEVDTKRLSIAGRPTDQGWGVPKPPGLEDSVIVPSLPADADVAPPPVAIDAILDIIEAAREHSAEDELAECVERAGETLGALMRRFPGKLRVDRFAVSGRPLRASQYGGLLELVVGLGSVASELLVDKMASAQRDVRFYATICTAELRPRNAVFALAERLFDQDYGVRATAIEALAGYPMQDLMHALVRVRRAIHSSDPEVVAAATTALVELGDVEAIGDLISAVERSDRGGEHARRALARLTAQEFGASERKWKKWYEGAKKRHRIEWLIDGLSHKDDAIRLAAINDLRRLTGEYFGYHHDLPKKEREAAAQRWAGWWREVGQRRFETQHDERARPTALLPARREP